MKRLNYLHSEQCHQGHAGSLLQRHQIDRSSLIRKHLFKEDYCFILFVEAAILPIKKMTPLLNSCSTSCAIQIFALLPSRVYDRLFSFNWNEDVFSCCKNVNWSEMTTITLAAEQLFAQIQIDKWLSVSLTITDMTSEQLEERTIFMGR